MDQNYRKAILDDGRKTVYFLQPAEMEWHHSKLITTQTTSRSPGKVGIIWY